MKTNGQHIYLIFILGIIIVIFAILKQITILTESVEGMTDGASKIIKRPDGYKVKRRKKSAIIKESMIENYKEGIKIPGLSSITNGIKSMTSGISNIFKKVTDMFTKLGKFFSWIGNVFVALFSYIECGFYKVVKLPQCMGWYLLEMIGHILYIPFAFFFWVTGTQNIEKQLWDMIEQVDCFCYESTGYHLIHYSDTIINNCYNCTIKPIPEFPF